MTFAEFCAWLWINSGRNFWTKIAPGLAGLLTFALMRDSIAPARAILTGLSAVVATYVIVGLWYRRQIRFFWLAVAGTFILAMLLSLVAVTGYDLAADFVRSGHWGESVADRLERECKEIIAKAYPEMAWDQNTVQLLHLGRGPHEGRGDPDSDGPGLDPDTGRVLRALGGSPDLGRLRRTDHLGAYRL